LYLGLCELVTFSVTEDKPFCKKDYTGAWVMMSSVVVVTNKLENVL
jgi:hypothetical protein